MPFHSDIDLLFLTERAISAELEEGLVNQTYPLFLECGRQISPQFRTFEEFNSPENEQRREFVKRVRAEGRILFELQTEPGSPV